VPLSLLLVAGLFLANCAAPAEAGDKPAPEVAEAPAAEALLEGTKILRLNLGGPGDVPTLDPAIAEDTTSLQIIGEAFIGLTYLDAVHEAYKAGMATRWDTADNPDGTQAITFHIRNDVPWVRWNGEEVETVKSCDGASDRLVDAHDFAYGIERNLNPASASPYAYLWGFVLQGAADYNNGVTADFSSVGVRVIDDFTIQLTFLGPAAYNVQIAGMWIGQPQPRWVIEGDCDGAMEARGERWTEPGFFQSYGPYTMSEWIHDSQLILVKNPYWPGTEAVPAPRIDEIRFSMIDAAAAFSEYEAENLDQTFVPPDQMDRVQADPVLSREMMIVPATCSAYFGFNTTAPVVNDVRVRRALSMAIDRQALIDNLLKGGQEAAQWFGNPGITGAPTMQTHPDLGIKYDPEAARGELQSYLDETGQSADDLDLTVMFTTSATNQGMAEAVQQMWFSELGVQAQLVSQEWAVYLTTTRSLDTPQIWRLGWCYDYPDENNFVRDVFASSGAGNPTDAEGRPSGGTMWKNDAFEDLVARAAVEQDPAKRLAMYVRAEEILVDTDAVIIPLYWSTYVYITKPYVQVPGYAGGGADPLHEWDILPH